MKFADLKLMTIPRLKAYRRTLYAKIGPYEHCWCGSPGCDFEMDHNRKNPKYKNLLIERDRVNKELAKRQLAEINSNKNPADVPTIKKMFREARKSMPWLRVPSYDYTRRQKMHRKATTKPVLEKTTVTFHFEQTGFNAHVADLTFTYDTPELAAAAAQGLKKHVGVSNIQIV